LNFSDIQKTKQKTMSIILLQIVKYWHNIKQSVVFFLQDLQKLKDKMMPLKSRLNTYHSLPPVCYSSHDIYINMLQMTTWFQ